MNCNGYNRLYHSLLPVVGWFGGWLPGTAVVPEQYWNVYSHEQRMKWLACTLEKLVGFVNGTVVNNLNQHADEIERLNVEFEKFRESGFDDYYAEQVAKWIDEHLQFIFDHVVKQVFFGLTDDGYFCAYIPDSWGDIEFDTGMVYGQFDYGRLILRFNADGSGVIDNTGRYDDRYVDLERRVAHNENTLYSPMQNGGTV